MVGGTFNFELCAYFALIDINQNGAHYERQNKKFHVSSVPGYFRNLTTEVKMYSLMLFIVIGIIENYIHVMSVLL